MYENGVLTGAVRYDPILQLIVGALAQRMGCTSDLERSDLLKILAFEIEIDQRLAWWLTLVIGPS